MKLGNKLQMLVADDSAVCRAIFRDFAARSPQPIDLVEARDGDECLAHIERFAFDIAFLDVHMPGITGIEALYKLREQGNHTFTVIMSSKPRDSVVDIARQLRAYDFLAKPFTTDAIKAILRNYSHITRPMNVLIVDDSATVRKIVLKVLTRSIFKLTCDEVESGEEACLRNQDNHYDIIFLDYNMPGMNGAETFIRLREQKPDARIILTSSEPESTIRQRLRPQKLDVFLPKPFYQEHLDQAIHSLFGLRPTYQL